MAPGGTIFQVRVMEYAEELGPTEAARHYKVKGGHGVVIHWLENKKDIVAAANKHGKRKATLHPGKRSRYHTLEGRLRRWLIRRRRRYHVVTKRMLIRQAKHWSPDIIRRQTGCLVERIPQAASYYNAPCDLLPPRHG